MNKSKTNRPFSAPATDKGFNLVDERIGNDLTTLAWYRRGYQLKVINFDMDGKIIAEGMLGNGAQIMEQRY
jgi:hypothetical protein